VMRASLCRSYALFLSLPAKCQISCTAFFSVTVHLVRSVDKETFKAGVMLHITSSRPRKIDFCAATVCSELNATRCSRSHAANCSGNCPLAEFGLSQVDTSASATNCTCCSRLLLMRCAKADGGPAQKLCRCFFFTQNRMHRTLMLANSNKVESSSPTCASREATKKCSDPERSPCSWTSVSSKPSAHSRASKAS
jgi:hypothetical protein